MENTENYKAKLEEEKVMITKELGETGHANPQNPTDFHPEPDNAGPVEIADKNMAADRHEEFEQRTVINEALEARLANINAALERIEAGTYGMCSVGDHPIEADRLDANPSATTCKGHME